MKTDFIRIDIGEKTVCGRRGCSALVPMDWRHCVGFGIYECLSHREVEMASRSRASKDPEQIIMPGIVSEMDVFRGVMRKIGSKGGRRNSPAQQAHRANVVKLMNEKRRMKRENENRG